MTMEEEKKNSGQTFGIAALIIAIITFIIAVIPCIGLTAIIPGIIAIVLASVGLSQTYGNNSSRGILIAGLVIGIVASVISLSQYVIAGKLVGKWPNSIENIIEEVQENVVKELKDASVSIKVENGDEKVEINVNQKKKEKEQILEELEKGITSPDDTLTGTE